MTPILPDFDPNGLPAPVWLLNLLSLLTFTLHLVAMNMLAGGATIMAICWARAAKSPFHATLGKRLAAALPVTMSITITLGIAPLLFLQVIWSQAFYTSSVLMAWPWMAVIPLVMLAYYGLYIARFRPDWLGGNLPLVSWLSALMILATGFMLSTNSTLMLRPALWPAMYAASGAGLHMNMGDHTLIQRYLHFVVAAFAVAGLGIAVLGHAWRKDDPDWSPLAVRYGARWFAIATGVELLVGVGFLFSLPAEIRRALTGGSQIDTIVLVAGILPALLAQFVTRRMPWVAALLTVVTVAAMAFTRHRVREMMLAPYINPYKMPVNPQWALFAAFALILVAGLAVVVWMVLLFARSGRGLKGKAA